MMAGNGGHFMPKAFSTLERSEPIDIYWQLILFLSVGHKLTPVGSPPTPDCILIWPIRLHNTQHIHTPGT